MVAAAAASPSIMLSCQVSLDGRLLNVYRGGCGVSSRVKGTVGSLWVAGSWAPLPAPPPPVTTGNCVLAEAFLQRVV